MRSPRLVGTIVPTRNGCVLQFGHAGHDLAGAIAYPDSSYGIAHSTGVHNGGQIEERCPRNWNWVVMFSV